MTDINLNDIIFGENKFCGPSVISAITKISTDDAAKRLAIHRKCDPKYITGVTLGDLAFVFDELEYKTNLTIIKPSRTLFAVLSLMKVGIYVIMVPGHFIAIEATICDRVIVDNHVRVPINAAVSARLHQKVSYMLKVEKR